MSTVIYVQLIISDVNECLSNATYSCSQLCTNTIGSYDCSCYEGYTKMFRYFCFGKIMKPQRRQSMGCYYYRYQ